MSKKIRTIVIIVTIILAFGTGIVYWKWPRSKTPKGIDPSPIYNMEINGQFDLIEELEKNIPEQYHHEGKESRVPGEHLSCGNKFGEKIVLFGLHKGAEHAGVYRNIGVYQFSSDEDALAKYLEIKKYYTSDDSYNYNKVFDEQGDSSNKYIIFYVSTHLDCDHLVFCEINNDPDITVYYLKDNLIICVSYVGFSDYSDYVNEINEDIANVSQMIGNAIKKMPKKEDQNFECVKKGSQYSLIKKK